MTKIISYNKNTLLSKEVHKLILHEFNRLTLPLLAVKRTTKLNPSNCFNIISLLVKCETLEEAMTHIRLNSVIDGKPQSFASVTSSFGKEKGRYYHGVNVTKFIEENGGFPKLYENYEKDENITDFCASYLAEGFFKKEEKPQEEKPFEEPKEEDEDYLDLEDFLEEKEEEPKKIEFDGDDALKVLRELAKEMVPDLNEKAKTQIKDEVYAVIPEIVALVANLKPEKVIVINGEEKKLPNELYHQQFSQICNLVANKFNIYLYGEAGDGKTHLVRQIAKALNLEFLTMTPSDAIGLLGYTDINGVFQETPFTKWAKNGGLLYLSEFDNVGDAILSINTALANGFVTINGKRVDLNKNCHFVADGNTKGNGSDSVYTGRNVIDGATMDRFLFVELVHDYKLELALCGNNSDLIEFMKVFREIKKEKRIKCMATMRASQAIYKLESINYPLDEALKSALLKGLSDDLIATIVEGFKEKTSEEFRKENDYYKALKVC